MDWIISRRPILAIMQFAAEVYSVWGCHLSPGALPPSFHSLRSTNYSSSVWMENGDKRQWWRWRMEESVTWLGLSLFIPTETRTHCMRKRTGGRSLLCLYLSQPCASDSNEEIKWQRGPPPKNPTLHPQHRRRLHVTSNEWLPEEKVFFSWRSQLFWCRSLSR